MRTELETRLSRYPVEDRADLVGRFRSTDDQQMMAAFGELYLHEVANQLGWHLALHPDLPGTTNHPDFLVDTGLETFYLEGVVARPGTRAEIATERKVNQVHDLIDKLDSPQFSLDVDVIEAGPTSPPVGPLRAGLSRWLGRLDPDDVTRVMTAGGIYSWPRPFTWTRAGWEIEFIPIPKSERARGLRA